MSGGASGGAVDGAGAGTSAGVRAATGAGVSGPKDGPDVSAETVGVLALGRGTFDVPFAEAKLEAAFDALERTGAAIVGPRTLLMDGDAVGAALDAMRDAGVTVTLIVQATFTDAAATVRISERHGDRPLAVWAFPEPREGGRLRLNAFCGLNLAAHALGRIDRAPGCLYADPGTVEATTAAFPGFPEEIVLTCEGGVLMLKGTQMLMRRQDGGVEDIAPDEGPGGTGSDPMAFSHACHLAVWSDFADAIGQGRDPMVTASEALKVHRLIDALTESGRRGTTVRVMQ